MIALQNLSTSAIDRHEAKRKIAKQIIRGEKHLYEKKMIRGLKINRYNSKIFFNICGNIKNSYIPQTKKKKTSKNGTLITDKKQISYKFKDFFEKLLNRPIHKNEKEEINYHTVEPKIDKPYLMWQLSDSKIIRLQGWWCNSRIV